MKPIILQCTLLILFFQLTAFAQSVHEVKPSQQYEWFTEGIEVYPVCEGEVPTIEQVSQPEFQANFRADSVFRQGCQHWVKVVLYSAADEPLQYLFKNSDGQGATHYYLPKKNGTYKKLLSGFSVPPSERTYNYTKYNAVPILVLPNDTLTLYILQDYPTEYPDRKVRFSTATYDLKVQSFKESQLTELLVTMAALLLLVLYNLSVYLFVKDKTYLYYSLTFLLLIPYLVLVNGMGWHWVTYSDGMWYYDRAIASCGVLAECTYLLFSMAYLQGNRPLAKWEVTLRYVMYLSLGLSVVNTLVIIFIGYGIFYTPFSMVADGFFILTALVVCIYSIVLSTKGHKTAGYYALASVSFMPFLLVFYMQDNAAGYGFLGWIEGNWFTQASLKIGVVVQALTFSVALAARINAMRNRITAQQLEVEKAEREKLETVNQLIEQQNKELEAKVEARTLSLQEAVEELRQSEENLDQLNKAKDHLFAVVAHDLRGPVASFQGISKVLQFQMKKNRTEKVQELMQQVDGSANQLNILLDNLLQWAQTQMGGINFQPQNVQLKPIAEDVQTIYEGTALSKEITTTIVVEPPTLSVWADVSAVATIVRNIWSNALKFTDKGEVSLKAEQQAEWVVLTISDTGRGIAPEKLATIFEINAGKSTKGTFGEKGNGLGLTLCKQFAEKNGGEIAIESEVGKGTTVRIWLPAEK